MRIIIETVDDNELYSQTHTYSFKELGQEETMTNWIFLFRDILMNLGFMYDMVYDAIPDKIDEGLNEGVNEGVIEGVTITPGDKDMINVGRRCNK